MLTFLVKLTDLKFLSPDDLSGDLSVKDTIDAICNHFDHLPGEVRVEINAGVVTIQFEEATEQNQTEARRLFEKAAKRAKNGEFRKAKEIYERVLELDPARADARRELAMALFEIGDMEGAKNELIEALRLQPDDGWSYVVLGNIYMKHDVDLATAARFFTRALELKPGDPYALNGLAAASQKLGDSAKALECFDEAIAAHPEFANAWLGKAIVFDREDKTSRVIEVLDLMFSRAEVMDARSQPVFTEARKLYLSAKSELSETQLSDGFKALENYKAEVAALSGYPVKVRMETVPGQLSGVAQIAWKRGRDHHIVQISDRLAPPDCQHIEGHELTHIRLEALARKRGRNRWFATTAGSRELAIRSLASDIKKLERKGYSDDSITRVVLDLVGGLCGCIFNTPLDMLVETMLHRDVPAMRHAQFVSLHRLAREALAATVHPEIRNTTPPKVLRALTALNGASALFLDDFTHGATDFWNHYKRLDGANLSPRLFDLWKDRRDSLQPGDEYDLVDSFADLLGLRDWYEWKPDPGTHEVTQEAVKEGTTNPELLREKYPAAVWFLLDALKRYAAMEVDQVRTIAFEIGMLGRSGLDYSSAEKKYSLQAIPGETFSGLQLMCLMHAGFKRIAPDVESGMDLEEPFLQALKLFNA